MQLLIRRLKNEYQLESRSNKRKICSATTTGGYATKEDAIAFWNNRHELNSTDIIKKDATEKAEACDWEEGSDMSPDFENLKWIEEDE